ncbi:oxidoreductase, short chain dehydrogenase/reductase family protein [Dictyocaulus viviparus]|uniref:Oxidoreductase, short chain dehydrogenase/reductase family protein n=1 Tax=Dictyocaulus viviparus TaxID=29172 RepID=A0A0D8XBZ4_DICVI|nr:oxidoreductase, short chain dehydrogenase/reductase family protein [Dictyocaulus viviparus]
MSLRFDGRVAIITGAGGGLGRTYAIELAKRGCMVVVNDLGGDAHGTSASTSMADKVVNEIKAAGGQAVANYDSVEFGEKIVQTAISAFGRIDIVINNAGILRDVSIAKMTDLDWGELHSLMSCYDQNKETLREFFLDLIFQVHVKGAYSVTKAAWPYMKKQNYGRIIVTSSNAAIYGNFGQTNYAAGEFCECNVIVIEFEIIVTNIKQRIRHAKSALIGFANSLAEEGAKYNIVANTLIPTAESRLTKTVLPENLLKSLKPEYVTPLAVYLSHENFTDSGKVFEAGAGWYGELKYYRSAGKVIPNATAEDLRNNWDQITNMKESKHFENMRDHMVELIGVLSEIRDKNVVVDNTIRTDASNHFPTHIKCSALFQEINDEVRQNPTTVKNIKAIILYSITDGKKEIGKFTLDFKGINPSVYYGDVRSGENAAVTVTVSDEDFLEIANGTLNPQKAFMAGKLKVKGNVMLLQKLQMIFDKKKKAKL